MKTSAYILAASVSLFTLAATAPATACSDLPNICAMNAQAHQQNVDNAYMASEAYGQQQQEYLDSLDGPVESAYAPAPDPMLDRMDVAFGEMTLLLGQATETLEKSDAMMKDPKFQTYRAGFWDHFQDSRNPKPGEYCVALFTNLDGAISISGPGSNYNGALLTFWGLDIPAPSGVQKIKVTLDQTDTAPQTVTAFNYAGPDGKAGVLALAVPTAQAAMDGMVDHHNFKLSIEGKKVFDVTWKDGLAARKKLANCVSKYKG